MKLARYLITFFDSGEPKYVEGRHYVLNDETQAHIAQGRAVEVDINIDPDRAAKLKAKAQVAADKAAASLAQANADAAAAAEAAELARKAESDLAAGADEAAQLEAELLRQREERQRHADLLKVQADEAATKAIAAMSDAMAQPENVNLQEVAQAAEDHADSLQKQAEAALAAVDAAPAQE